MTPLEQPAERLFMLRLCIADYPYCGARFENITMNIMRDGVSEHTKKYHTAAYLKQDLLTGDCPFQFLDYHCFSRREVDLIRAYFLKAGWPETAVEEFELDLPTGQTASIPEFDRFSVLHMFFMAEDYTLPFNIEGYFTWWRRDKILTTETFSTMDTALTRH